MRGQHRPENFEKWIFLKKKGVSVLTLDIVCNTAGIFCQCNVFELGWRNVSFLLYRYFAPAMDGVLYLVLETENTAGNAHHKHHQPGN